VELAGSGRGVDDDVTMRPVELVLLLVTSGGAVDELLVGSSAVVELDALGDGVLAGGVAPTAGVAVVSFRTTSAVDSGSPTSTAGRDMMSNPDPA
jgi:hypothetical protein